MAESLESAYAGHACDGHSWKDGFATELTNGNPRTMARIDNHQQESHKPIHAGDSEEAMWAPAGDETSYLAGGKVVGLYPFGPLVGAAANCTLVGYNHKAFVGINVDAAAVPDLDMLAGCIREGFDAVIALGDVS